MTYAALASLSRTIDLILNYHQHLISPLFKYQITSIDKHTIFLQSFLEDFPDEAYAWEERMREAANVAEDVIEFLMSNSSLQSTVGSSYLKQKYEPHCDLHELGRVAEEIESIVREVKERDTESVGSFNDDLIEIISRLRGGSFVLEIIPIFGTEGTGKTTLATNAFNNPLIVEYFDIHAWATVSQDYSRRKIMLDLLGFMNNLKVKDVSNSEEELVQSVRKNLLGKRYLIVLDDIWSLEAWDKIKYVFPDDSNGSRILLTTRMQKLANHAASHSHIHEMCLMNEDQSWNLLRTEVFEHDPCPPKLEFIGKMIARSCRGHLLAIHLVSGVLRCNQSQSVWEDILENLKTATDCELIELLFRIFYLSYIYLPHHLRPCFLYLGIFPVDHEIRVSKLIKLWVAEGFLNESEFKSFEETGEEYVEDLVRRSLVLVRKRKSDGRIKSVSIPDLMMREMCIRQAHCDNFFLLVKSFLPQAAIKLQRRVCNFHFNHNFVENACGSTIRTAICLEGSQEGSGCSLQNLRLLRILDLSNSYHFFYESDLSEDVFELFHLRYLDFQYPFSIPAAISNLQNLQTLVIRPSKHCRQFVKLPVEIWMMPQLRHVVVHSCELPSPEAVSALENLQTLTEAVNFICSTETLKLIPNLNKLGIFYTEWRNPEEDYQLFNLKLFQKLEILKIATCNLLKKQHRISLAFNPTLRKLSFSGLGLPWEDMTVVGSLPNLQVLKLRDHACIGNTWETAEGGFSELEFLLIEKSDLRHWTTESSHFPRLKSLVLYHCKHLRDFPNDIGEISTLELIEVDDRNKSLVKSAKRIHNDQHILGNDSLQVRVRM